MTGASRPLLSAFAVCFALYSSPAQAAPFSPGNIVVLKQDATTPSSVSTTFKLVELSSGAAGGGTVQSISSNSSDCTVDTTATSEAKLTVSADGALVSWACYNTPSGAALPGSFIREVQSVNSDGALSAPLMMQSAMFSANFRSAVVMNAAGDCYVAGSGVPGLAYAPSSTGVPVQLTSLTNVRKAQVYNGSLYIATAAAAASGILLVGSVGALPTTGAQPVTQLVATSGGYPSNATAISPTAFVFESASTLWVCDQSTSTTYRGVWRLDGPATFYAPASPAAADHPFATAACADIAGQTEASIFTLYFVAGSSTSSMSVYRLISGAASATVLSASGTGAFNGLALVPIGPTVSQTPSATQTLSQSASSAPTASQTPSPSSSQTFSVSQSPTRSQPPSASQSQTPSRSALSPTSSQAQALSLSVTQSPSQSVSPTPSSLLLLSPSSSVTGTATLSPSSSANSSHVTPPPPPPRATDAASQTGALVSGVIIALGTFTVFLAFIIVVIAVTRM
jgi:hypothetical protein